MRTLRTCLAVAMILAVIAPHTHSVCSWRAPPSPITSRTTPSGSRCAGTSERPWSRPCVPLHGMSQRAAQNFARRAEGRRK